MRTYDSLRGDAEFARLRRRGRRADGTYVAVVATPSQANRRPRFGIVTVKGFGDAVDRNRARRRLRAVLEDVEAPALGMDMIVTARAAARRVPFAELRDDVRATLGRLEK